MSSARVVPLDQVVPRPRRVAVGTFDGVHLGHREVIAGADAVLTFEPHPVRVIAPTQAPRLITTLERKAELIGGLGVSELVVVPFDDAFAARSAESFIDEVLLGPLGATHVSVGENFRFGHRASGDAATLEADDRFVARVVPLLEVDGEVVSSSHIRGLLLGGAVEYADQLLGAPFTLSGEVVHGDERGREARLPDGEPRPARRLRHARARGLRLPGQDSGRRVARGRGQRRGPAAVRHGPRRAIEAHLLDFDGDLYDSELRLEFVKRLRGEKRFASVEVLVEQMDRDVGETRTLATLIDRT